MKSNLLKADLLMNILLMTNLQQSIIKVQHLNDHIKEH